MEVWVLRCLLLNNVSCTSRFTSGGAGSENRTCELEVVSPPLVAAALFAAVEVRQLCTKAFVFRGAGCDFVMDQVTADRPSMTNLSVLY